MTINIDIFRDLLLLYYKHIIILVVCFLLRLYMKIPKHHLPHIEALTQNIVGMIVAFIILKIFGMSFTESVLLQSIFFITSYIRSYAIRRVFKKIENME